MGIFGTKKNNVTDNKVEKPKVDKSKKAVIAVRATNPERVNRNVLVRPRVTEKASMLAGVSVYCFEITKDATKKQVSDAVKSIYGKTPVYVNIVRNPSKKVFRRGKFGRTGEIKKAYVALAKGEKIEVL